MLAQIPAPQAAPPQATHPPEAASSAPAAFDPDAVPVTVSFVETFTAQVKDYADNNKQTLIILIVFSVILLILLIIVIAQAATMSTYRRHLHVAMSSRRRR